MKNETNESQSTWSQLIAKCWMDAEFQTRLERDPRAVLQEAGVTIPADVTLRVVTDTPVQRTLVIPVRPTADGIQDAVQSRKAAVSCLFA